MLVKSKLKKLISKFMVKLAESKIYCQASKEKIFNTGKNEETLSLYFSSVKSVIGKKQNPEKYFQDTEKKKIFEPRNLWQVKLSLK